MGIWALQRCGGLKTRRPEQLIETDSQLLTGSRLPGASTGVVMTYSREEQRKAKPHPMAKKTATKGGRQRYVQGFGERRTFGPGSLA